MADWKSLFATPYRYEIELLGPSFFNWRRRQVDRIKAEEDNRLGLEAATEIQTARDCIDHIELLEQNASRRRAKRVQTSIKKEMQDENKANIRVRRAALRHQLEVDYKQYQKELNAQGRSIYFQRA